MHVRVFSLLATTALFGAVWSSDQRYQELQSRTIRAAQERLATEKPGSRASDVPRESSTINRPIPNQQQHRVRTIDPVLNWAKQVRCRLEEDNCLLRWQFRRTVYFGQRRIVAALREQRALPDVIVQMTHDALRKLDAQRSLDSEPRSAAVIESTETR